ITHNNQGLLSGKVVAVTDNANVGKHWHSVETEFGIGSYLTKWQTYQRCVRLTTWAEHGSLPAIADAIARSVETPTTSSPKPTVHFCHATNCGLAAEGDDIEQKHAFLPSFTPATFMRDVFWVHRLCVTDSECAESAFPTVRVCTLFGTCSREWWGPHRAWALRPPADSEYCQGSLLRRRPFRRGCQGLSIMSVLPLPCYPQLENSWSKSLGQSLRHRRDTMELIYIDLVGPLPPTRGPDGGYRFVLTWLDATSGFVGGIPLKKATSYEICNALERHVLLEHDLQYI
ncbi:hypothetical protein FOL47_003205, partial [Perkinsus chesapeaki]